MSSPSFNSIYEPLQGNEFRIIVLEPGKQRAEVCCTLITQKLVSDAVSDLQPYEALSYAWGDPTCTHTLRIGTEELGVAKNLFVALQYLRYETRPRILWIDAICINQADLSERSGQVQLMHLVYREADCVLVWLGEQNYNSDAAFDLIEKWAPLTRPSMGDFAHYFGAECGISSNETDVNTLIKAISLAAISTLSEEIARAGKPRSVEFRETIRKGGFIAFDYIEADFNDVLCLFQTFNTKGERPWWGRRWVVQEVMNGQKLEILCGRRSIPWSSITDFKNSVAHLSTWNYPTHSIMSTEIDKSLHNIFQWDYLRAQASLFLGENPTLSFEELLERFSRTRCSDPLDFIYSMLNISDLSESSFPVDYSKSVVEVFSNTTKMIIERSRNLTHLAFSRLSTSRDVLGGPTWMRDYSCLAPPSILLKITDMQRGPFYTAAGDFVLGDYFHQETRPKVLHLKGALHDTILSATNALEDDERNIKDTIRQWEPSSPNSESFLYPTGEDSFDAFWRTLQKDAIVHYDRAYLDTRELTYRPELRLNDSDIEPFRNYYLNWSGRQLPGDVMNDPESWRHPTRGFGATRNNLLGYCFVTSSQHYMGIVHGQAKVGDEIYVVEGSPIPLILRRHRNPFQGTPEFSANENFYTLVGVAYVHGIMDGEFWEKVKTGEKALGSLFIV